MDLTRLLRGKVLEHVTTNGHVLRVTATDPRTGAKTEIDLMWVDGEGRPIKGKPVALNTGYRLLAAGTQDLQRVVN